MVRGVGRKEKDDYKRDTVQRRGENETVPCAKRPKTALSPIKKHQKAHTGRGYFENIYMFRPRSCSWHDTERYRYRCRLDSPAWCRYPIDASSLFLLGRK